MYLHRYVQIYVLAHPQIDYQWYMVSENYHRLLAILVMMRLHSILPSIIGAERLINSVAGIK